MFTNRSASPHPNERKIQLMLCLPLLVRAAAYDYDLVVYGSSPAGIAAVPRFKD